MNFIAYDVIFFVLFTLLAVIFLYRRKHKLARQGLLYLYRTRVGIEFIEWTSKKCARVLRPMQYLVLTSGYALMAMMIWLLIQTAIIYIQQPASSPIAKVPAVFPLVPYFPQLFNLDSIFPPFYFTYFIVAIAIIVVSHEFAHGIFARLNKVKIHSTGFAFLGPFLGAFVEQDDKQMNKASKFAQLSILAAGTFANVVMAVLFGILLWLFFAAAFVPAGIQFNTYATGVLNVSNVDSVHGKSVFDFTTNELFQNEALVNITSANRTYYAGPQLLRSSLMEEAKYILVYEDSPALHARIGGAITALDDKKITSYDDLRATIRSYQPGDNVSVTTIQRNGTISTYHVTLDNRDGIAFLGIARYPTERSGFMGSIYNAIAKVKNPEIYYKSTMGDLGIFIYDMLWWIVIINILVALCNMLPAGIFDGGRFFYLTIWGVTGSKKAGENAFKLATWLILAVVALMMIKWVFNIF